MDINEMDIDEIERVLWERKNARKESLKPKPLDAPNFDTLTKYVKEYIDKLADDGWIDEDEEHYIFEAATESVFGKSVWGWIRKQK